LGLRKVLLVCTLHEPNDEDGWATKKYVLHLKILFSLGVRKVLLVCTLHEPNDEDGWPDLDWHTGEGGDLKSRPHVPKRNQVSK
jgi:hypothetical protein